ncbi:hypothetical protein AVEN_231874-1, partial [Araneus ventricosus]
MVRKESATSRVPPSSITSGHLNASVHMHSWNAFVNIRE